MLAMKHSSRQFTLSRFTGVVAAVVLISVVISNASRPDGITDKRVVIPVASAYGLWAMRRPLPALLPLLVLWVADPRVDHPSPDVINVSAGMCFVSWIIGAPAGWISRGLAKAGKPPLKPTGFEPDAW